MTGHSLVDTSLRNWNEQNKRLVDLVNSLSSAQLASEIAPKKNTGNYLVGHLAAINYNMIVLLGLGENPHPGLDTVFLLNADKAVAHSYTMDGLKERLFDSIRLLEEKTSTLSEADWFDRHMNVTPEEFKTQPHRNRIHVLISRTLHLAYHLGQLSLLK